MLEIGPGTGANLEFYPEDVKLTLLEPSPYMQQYLKEKAEKLGREVEIHTGVAEEIPFPDGSFDSVISTLVLCSVDDIELSLSEIRRILKPGGRFYFMEHVAAPEDSRLHTIQNLLTPLWKRMADGCHPNRNTGTLIQDSSFTDVNIESIRINLPVVGPHIIGSATKPD